MTKNAPFHEPLNIMRTCALFAMALLLIVFMSPASCLSAETTALTIIHSGNVNGHLFPCPT